MITFQSLSSILNPTVSSLSLCLSLKLLLVYAATPAKVASLPVDSLGTVSRVAQMGCETLTDPDPNLTPLKVTGTTCVCISVSVYVRLAQCRCLEKPFIMLLITISMYVKIQRFFIGVRVYDLLLTGQQRWPLLAMEADILLKCQA